MGVAGLLFLLGIICFVFGSALSFQLLLRPFLENIEEKSRSLIGKIAPSNTSDQSLHYLGGGVLLLGFYFMLVGLRKGFLHLVETLNPNLAEGRLGNVYLRRQRLAQGPRIVALGGGTGLSTLLRGLKTFSSNITAVVTVTDDGGSSGVLRKEMDMIPPGDIRNCLVALADAEKAMTDLFQYRFKQRGGSLSGHSMGNLLIAALVDQAGGDFEKAVEMASNVLSISGEVLPSTLDKVGLMAWLNDGREVRGETAIVEAGSAIRRIFLDPSDISPNHSVIEALRTADLIVIGPGSVYTSIIPNLLVPGVSDAIRASKAVKAYVCNVMTQTGESDSFSASEHVSAIQINVQKRVFDYVLINSASPSDPTIERYRESGQHFVEPDYDRIKSMGFKVVQGGFINESDLVRHDPLKLAKRLIGLLD